MRSLEYAVQWLAFLLVVLFSQQAIAQSTRWQWTSSALPNQVFATRQAAESALRALGGKYALASVVTGEQVSDGLSTYTYGAQDQDLAKGDWGYCLGTGCPYPSHDAAVAAWKAANQQPGCPSPSTADTPYWSWYPVGWQPYQTYPGSDVTTQEKLEMLYANWSPPQCNVYYGPLTMYRTRSVDCPTYLAWNTTRKVCELKSIATISGAVSACPVCNAPTGDHFTSETDLDLGWIQVVRNYHSATQQKDQPIGVGWATNLNKHLLVDTNARPTGIVDDQGYQSALHYSADVGNDMVYQASTTGQTVRFLNNELVTETSSGRDVYDRYTGHWLRTQKKNGNTLSAIYDGAGRLSAVYHSSGRYIELVHDSASGQINRITVNGQTAVQYAYDANGDLSQVVEQDGTTRGYTYGTGDQAHLLTSVVDEASTAYASATYDTSNREIDTASAGGVAERQTSYGADGSATVTTALGEPITYTFTAGDQFPLPVASAHPNGTDVWNRADYSVDNLRRVRSHVDRKGVTTTYEYSQDNTAGTRLVRKTEASGTPYARVVEETRDLSLDLLLAQKTYNTAGVLVASQFWTYNSRGQVLTASRIDPVTNATSTTTTTYCEQADVDAGTCPLVGLIRSVNGPRTDVSDVTSYTYYASDDGSCASAPTTCPHRKGDLWKVTNALGQVTETLAYDGAGRVLSVKDPNGVVTDLTYSLRGWLTARKVRGPDNAVETDDAITRIDYWPTGLVKQVTQPDGSYTAYGYDAAHRLTDISDNAGNTVHYTLDNAGNRTAEDTKDPSGTLTRTLSRVYNQLGQLQSQHDAALHATTFTYDTNGNGDLVTDAASHVTDSDYDPLNRLKSTLQDVGGIAARTQFQYDAVDELAQVTDPNGLVTGYGYDGLGNLTSLSSPDTGVTSYTYDSAGNRTSQTDARAKVTNYSYDALNRLATTTYGTTSLNITSTYDTVNAVCGNGETFAVGRLAKLAMGNGDSTQYCYDRFGNPVRKVETISGKMFTLRYSYNFAGRLLSMTYPDGNVADYVRNAMGQVIEVGETPPGGARQVLLTSVAYYPFGPAKQWTFGNGRVFQRTLDLDYRPWTISDNSTGGLSLGYTFDAVGNLTELRDAGQAGPPQTTFVYDALYRLTDFIDGPTGVAIEHYAYDATGNRVLFQNSSGSQTYAYDTGTHHLGQAGSVARSYDAAGNTTAIGSTSTFTYSDANRMDSAKQNGTTVMNYSYNGQGERVHRFLTTTGTNQTYTVYDEAGHWIGDYDSNGAAVQQAIWLDDLPVGLMANASANQKLDYVEADALSTPRAVIDPTRNVAIWSWDLKGEAFGNSPPNQDPDFDGNAFVFNLRFPGQQSDSASNLNYNYFRDYDAVTGRYVESDPMGLRAGLTTYGYVEGDPLGNLDPTGLRYVNLYVWYAEGGSVGHVMVTEDGSKQVILSQFPANDWAWGPNQTKDWDQTIAKEKRGPSSVWRVYVPNDQAFDRATAHERALKRWLWTTSDDSTQCSIAAARALEAGGVGITAITSGTLMPKFFENNLEENKEKAGNKIRKLWP